MNIIKAFDAVKTWLFDFWFFGEVSSKDSQLRWEHEKRRNESLLNHRACLEGASKADCGGVR